jgi:hypothetical protein
MITKDQLELLKTASEQNKELHYGIMGRGDSSVVPEQDQNIAEETWRHNHIEAHESGFKRSSEKLKNAVHKNFNPSPESFDTDLGYGAGQLFMPSKAKHQLESFKQLMKEMPSNDKER